MICVHCRRDSRYRSRKDHGRCSHCGRAFAFEPKQHSLLTDRMFERAIENVRGGRDGRLRFTTRQLWYELNRRLDRIGWFESVAAIVLAVALGAALAYLAWPRLQLWPALGPCWGRHPSADGWPAGSGAGPPG